MSFKLATKRNEFQRRAELGVSKRNLKFEKTLCEKNMYYLEIQQAAVLKMADEKCDRKIKELEEKREANIEKLGELHKRKMSLLSYTQDNISIRPEDVLVRCMNEFPDIQFTGNTIQERILDFLQTLVRY